MTRPRIYSKNPSPQEGLCLLIENGAACNRTILYRGLCNTHVLQLKGARRLEEFALPQESRKRAFTINPASPDPGVCRLLVDGVPCHRRATRSTLCTRHLAAIKSRKDLRLEDFVHPGFKKGHSRKRLPEGIRYARQKSPTPGLCVVREQLGETGPFTYCKEEVISRGLCPKHRVRLFRWPRLFEEIANPAPKGHALKLKHRLTDGICVIVDNEVGCEEPTTKRRRVCDHHERLLKYFDLWHELTDRFFLPPVALEPRPAEARVPGFCAVVVNGVPCTNPPKRRGLCQQCLWIVERDKLDFERFALPIEPREGPVLERREHLVPGACALKSDGVPCEAAARLRGLCKRHYKAANRQHRLAELGLTPEEHARLGDLPHLYFDKNVPIRFAMHEIFGVTPDRASVALVTAVLKGRIRATVSLDCVRALYSHVGHRLARAVSEGGKGLDEKTAERTACAYAGELFFKRGGFWHFLPFTQDVFNACAAQEKLPDLSLEDALEVHLYASAKASLGAVAFVTADAGILKYGDAVHPDAVARNLAYLLESQGART
jgi:hypothetical protein